MIPGPYRPANMGCGYRMPRNSVRDVNIIDLSCEAFHIIEYLKAYPKRKLFFDPENSDINENRFDQCY